MSQRTLRAQLRRHRPAPARRPARTASEVEDRPRRQGCGQGVAVQRVSRNLPTVRARPTGAGRRGVRPWRSAALNRLLRKRSPFDGHLCRGGVARTAAGAPLFPAIARNSNLGTTLSSGAAIHQTIRHRAQHAGYGPTTVAKLGENSLRAGYVTQGSRNGADGSAIARQTGHTDHQCCETSSGLDSAEVYGRKHASLAGNAVRYRTLTGKAEFTTGT